jgi:hypothetical protein
VKHSGWKLEDDPPQKTEPAKWLLIDDAVIKKSVVTLEY